MDVLPALTNSPSPGTPRPVYSASVNSLFDRRSSKLSADAQHSYRHISVTIRPEPAVADVFEAAVPPTGATAGAKARQSRRLTTCGFLPLPPISASPVCTPTTSSSRHMLGDDMASLSSGTDDYLTAPPTPSDSGSSKSCSPPTWISIPPTPPPKLFRRSVTCVARPPRSPALSPSASFPAQFDARIVPKRRASVPTIASYARDSSSSPAVRPRSSKNGLATDAIVAASPLRPAYVGARTAPSAFSNRSQAMFSISHHVSYENDEDLGEGSGSNEGSADTSSSDHSHVLWHVEKSKDDLRKYHALMELLSTEMRYLMDLRVLVMIYLRQLATITCRTPSGSAFGRNSSFSSASRSNSHTYLHTALNSSSVTIADMHGLQPMTSMSAEKKDKSMPRFLFTHSDIDILTRNAEEVLQFHEHLVEEMRAVMIPLGFSMDFDTSTQDPSLPSDFALSNLQAGLSFVATKFATEASRFNAYESFCAGHPEALDIVRKAQQQYNLEWETYEQRCSALIFDLLDSGSSPSSDGSDTHSPQLLAASSDPIPPLLTQEKKRRSSISSIDGAMRGLRPKLLNTPSSSDGSSRDKRRLTCLDYMITPVQRICRYPLLLDQLKTSTSLLTWSSSVPLGRSDANVIVESASQAMKHVASRVDEARHRHDVALQSSLIVTRISRSTPSLPSAQASRATFQFLTPSFLSSLGVCLLAGSLDVMHHHWARQHASINAKYLGAFLYLGGYLILVKVSKGKTYEPKHWFRLSDFELLESDEDALLPCSFRLSNKGHQFELAAACQREKEAWMTSIRESLSHTSMGWVNEPTSSLQADSKGEPVSSTLDGPFEPAITPLPTIQSIPDVGKGVDYPEITDSLLAALATDPNPTPRSRLESSSRSDTMPSRRSSTASVKAMFNPGVESDTVVIRRSSPSARTQVDHGLRDVISEPCLTARSHASSREEELFQAPSIVRSGPPIRSQSTLSMSRLKKHESVRVPRRKSIVVGNPDTIFPRKSGSRAKSLTVKKRPKKLSITSTNSDGESAIFIPVGSEHSSELTQSPATTLSFPMSSTVSSPTRDTFITTRPSSMSYEIERSRARSTSRPNSLVGFFKSRPSSPARSTTSPARSAASTQTRKLSRGELAAKPSSSTFKRWMKGPFHRRTHSAPEEKPSDESPVLPDLCFGKDLELSLAAAAAAAHS